jgi:hypothetical protein
MLRIVLYSYGFDSQAVVHGNYGYREWSSGIVSNERKRATYLITA